jgi:hypothetical protein
MHESELQSTVTQSILYGDAESVQFAITDNENAVIVSADECDAAYTADEAQRLADRIEEQSEEYWKGNNGNAIEYLQDLASVVDNDKIATEVEKSGDSQEIAL